MAEIIKHINDTNASYRDVKAGDAKNTDLFLDNEHYELFRGCGDQITVRFSKENLSKAILFIASILPRKYDNSGVHMMVPFSSSFVLEQLALLDAIFVEDGKPVETRTQTWNVRKDVPKKNGTIDNRFYFNGLIEDIEYLYQGQRKEGKFTIRNYVAGSFSDLHIIKNDDNIFDVRVTNVLQPYDDGKEHDIEEIIDTPRGIMSLQQIFYGAPGTGKSNMTNLVTAKHPGSIRTTFHPDSDYSTFVGAYKPTMEMVDICDEKGQAMKIGDVTLRKEQITYKFVKQAFLKAYIQAWKLYQQTAVEGEEVAPQFLVIEEINRGNCAQIFGDLFQLLDRKNGFSEYPIEADEDIRKCLLQKDTDEDPNFGENGLNLSPEQKAYIDSIFDPEDGTKRHVADKICKGELLVLPPNLYIWATMNTSDQSLFPIDSAFKRRWDWKYMRITNHPDKAWKIHFDNKDVEDTNSQDPDWWTFIKAINKHIKKATHSEDKQLGYFFCKAKDDKYITPETFVGKVIFYLWNDVFKTSGYKKTIFNNMDFDSFYTDENYDEKTNPDGIDNLKVREFIENVIETAKEL